jgi:tetratricopeptide (TPR) repeat protein
VTCGVLLAGPPVLSQQEEEEPPAYSEAQQHEMQLVQDLLARATVEFEGTQQSRSIVLFDEIIAKLENLRAQGTLSPRGQEILVQAYEYRGRAYYNIGLQEKAADSFRSVIQIQPQHAMGSEVSPKVVDYFESVKKSLVGYLAVSTTPPGARVTLDGNFLSLTDFFPIEVLAGEYTIEIARDGYAPVTRVIGIAPRATETINEVLTRTAGSCFFITEPAGVEIYVDDQHLATTSGNLHPELHDFVREKGLDPANASARTEVANLSLGSHVIELRKPCYETVRTTLPVEEPRDYEMQPIRLEDSLATLRLRSEPPGAQIFLDGDLMGQTPKDLEGVCSGKHRLEVKHASGKFIQDITLARYEELTLDCPIRPSLAFLGVVAESEAAERLLPEVEAKLIENLSRITTLNFVPAPTELVDRVLADESIGRADLIPDSGTSPDVLRRVTERLAAPPLEVQGFLIARLPDEKLLRTVTLHLLAAGNTVSDQWEVVFSEATSYIRFLGAVDQKTTVFRPWTGLITVDTLLHEGVPVVRVVPGSPAAQAGIEPGEVVYSAQGEPLRRTAELLDLIAASEVGRQLDLHLQGPSGERTVTVTVGETPQEIPLNDPALLYNKVMMDLRQKVEGYPGTPAAALARLNLALCAMHFGDFAAAHEYLTLARSELPTDPGISQGTALYYLGLTLGRLGYDQESRAAYQAAAGFEDATLFNNDGPAVAPIARRRAGS